jgi:cysteate synthase
VRELGRPCAYRSDGLARRLGLRRLTIAFSGYWPERGARLPTGTFKEFECQASVARYMAAFPTPDVPPLIVASAGNTGNGYNLLTTVLGVPLYLLVPESGLASQVLPVPSRAKLLVVRGDYSDAIALASKLETRLGAKADGGVRNVARRAGMAAVYLNAVAHPEQGAFELFEHYFQAIGSGSGAIATLEAVRALLRDGRFGTTVTRIHVAQNEPFTPIVDSWQAGAHDLVGYPAAEVSLRVSAVAAPVLTNRTPPYAMAGAMYDTLIESRGAGWRVTNQEAFRAARLFRETEGVEIAPAAAVATAALAQAVAEGAVGRDSRILLHVTGGGPEARADHRRYKVEPCGWVDPDDEDSAVRALEDPGPVRGEAAALPSP